MDFLTSLAVIFLSSLVLASICRKLGLPQLVGVLALGLLIGQHALNLIAPSIVAISSNVLPAEKDKMPS